jgi:ATP-dependent exoDNAse (exonuclease V) beta subunit
VTLFDVAELEPLLGPGGRPFTPEQAEAVRRRSGALLLSANAGSGKTSVLVERIVRLALEDDVPPSQVLAITFTEKAAGELRARVRARFAELGRRDLAAEAEAAQLSTIHGLCATVLRSHAAAAGLDPGFRVLDEREARGLRDAAFEAALAAFLADDPAGSGATQSRPATFAPWANSPATRLDLVAAYGVDRLADVVREVHDERRSRGRDVAIAVPELPSPPDPATLLGACRDALAALDGVAGKRVGEAVARLEALRDVLEAGPATAAQLAAGAFSTRGAKALGTPPCLAYAEALAAASASEADARAAEVLRGLDALVGEHARAYAAGKAEVGAVDFDDLELRTRDLLRDAPAVREAVRARFARVMVDEFQDTNPLQLELLDLLTDGAFEVGDERQSIYGFRHADVAVFRARRAQREAVGAALTLATNFRTAPEVLTTLNGLFAPRFGRGWAPLAPGRTDLPALAVPRVELHVTTVDGWDDAGLQGALPDDRACRHAEARHVARRVREIVETTHLRAKDVVVLLRATSAMEVFDRALADEGLQTLAAGSAGWWARRQVLDLCAYLGALANPRDEEALFALLACPLVGLTSDGLAAVAAAAPPGDRADVLERLAAGTPAERCVPGLPDADAARLAGFASWFAAERAGAARRGLDELLERAVVARGYDLHVLGLPGGRRRLANVLKLQRLAAEAQARLGRDVRAFTDLARAELEAEAREVDAPVDLGDQDAVRLMTMHAAKGLEFPCVVVTDLGRDARLTRPVVTQDDRGRVGLRLVALDRPEPSDALDHAELLAERHAAEHAEEDRVHYVAMTRAEELLVLSGTADPAKLPDDRPGRAPIGWVVRGLVADAEARLAAPEAEHEVRRTTAEGHAVRVRLVRHAPGDPDPVRPPAPAQPPQLELHLPGTAAARPDVLDPIPAPGPAAVATLSYSSLRDHAACGYRFYLQRVLRLPRERRDRELAARLAAEEGRPDDAPARPRTASGLDPRFRGSLVHELLEALDARATMPPAATAIRERAAAMDDGDAPEELSDAQIADVQALIAAYLASDLRRRVVAAPWSGRERPFAFGLGEGRPLVNGVLDLVAREADGGWLVLDFKTDPLAPGDDPEALVARDYGLQRRLYALAALHAGAPHVEVVHQFLERPEAPAAVRWTAADRDALAVEVLDAARGLLAGDFAPSPAPHRGLCLGCPGRRALCSHPPEATLRALPA